MNYFYVYRVTLPETGEYYFGSRKCTCIPEKDKKYKGSMCTWKPDKSKLVKEILFTNFLTHQDAILKETELILENKNDLLNKNFSTPNGAIYIKSPKEWILKKNGIEKGNQILSEIYKNNSSIWRKGNKPWDTGKHLSEDHCNNIKKTWHSEKRMNIMKSKEYSEKMSESLSGEKNPMFKKTFYEIWYIKYGKEIADKKLKEWHEKKKHKIPWNKGTSKRKPPKKCWVINTKTKERRFIEYKELENYINNGWRRGRKNY
jgi:hypothetical protein